MGSRVLNVGSEEQGMPGSSSFIYLEQNVEGE